MCKSLLCECWLWEEPVWSRRLNSILCSSSGECWTAGGDRAQVALDGCTFGLEGSKLFLAGEAWELVAGWMCVRWSVSVLWWAAAGSVGLRSGDQMSLMKNPMSCGTVLWALISIASLTLRWCQNLTGAMSLACFHLVIWSCSCELVKFTCALH